VNATPPEFSDRASERQHWARVATGDPGLQLASASSDAGFRSYWRGQAHGSSCIVMDSPPALEDVRPWLRMQRLLETAGVRVPRVMASDEEAGFLLLEDLGARTYLDLIHADSADRLFDKAIEQLLLIQRIPTPAGLQAYDPAMLMRELRLFDEWFLERHLGVQLDAGESTQLQAAYERLIAAAIDQPQVLVHRDFMPRNLMPANELAAVLDFQDAVRGPLAYDVLSLFKDAFHSWPQARVDRWLQRYRERAVDAGVPVPGAEQFGRDADWIGVQRHLKVLGIFARLHYRDHKPKYLADAPRFIAYLQAVLPRYPELAVLGDIISQHVHPATASLSLPHPHT